jgi:hypothetical protein
MVENPYYHLMLEAVNPYIGRYTIKSGNTLKAYIK